jgi:hypothetical protein
MRKNPGALLILTLLAMAVVTVNAAAPVEFSGTFTTYTVVDDEYTVTVVSNLGSGEITFRFKGQGSIETGGKIHILSGTGAYEDVMHPGEVSEPVVSFTTTEWTITGKIHTK